MVKRKSSSNSFLLILPFLFTSTSLLPYFEFLLRVYWLKLPCGIFWHCNNGLPWVPTLLHSLWLNYPLNIMFNCACLSSSKFFIFRKQLYTHFYAISTRNFIFSRRTQQCSFIELGHLNNSKCFWRDLCKRIQVLQTKNQLQNFF